MCRSLLYYCVIDCLVLYGIEFLNSCVVCSRHKFVFDFGRTIEIGARGKIRTNSILHYFL